MTDLQESPVWDPFGFGEPDFGSGPPVQQFSSRREARAAEGSRRSGRSVASQQSSTPSPAPNAAATVFPGFTPAVAAAPVVAAAPAPTAAPAVTAEPIFTAAPAVTAAPASAIAAAPVAASAPAVEHLPSRRSIRETSRAAVAVPPAAPSTPTAAPTAAPSAFLNPAAIEPRSAVVPIKAFGPTTKKVRRNPLSVITTMVAVTGMFAVAGLPAYATVGDTAPAAGSAAATQLETQSVVVDASADVVSAQRDGYHATSPEQLAQMERDALRASLNAAYNASGARALGDDYPWPYELADVEGGGLSPLNYFYRECVDFVAWRLNRDAGSYKAPFKWTWSNLTPTGGNASQWRYAWENHGWPMSTKPIVGSVAWFNGNHVAYVTRVNTDGTVFIEEYNHGGTHVYGQRTIPATDVAMFLYPPPG